MLKKGFWSVAPFFIRQPPPPAHLCSACRKICRSFGFNYFFTQFSCLLCRLLQRSPPSLPISLYSYRLSSFSVALHISAAAHKFCSVCPSSKGRGGAFVKNHCCYSNFMEIPTLFLAFSFQRTDLRLRKICLSYAALRLILQKTEPKMEAWQKKNYCWACSCSCTRESTVSGSQLSSCGRQMV